MVVLTSKRKTHRPREEGRSTEESAFETKSLKLKRSRTGDHDLIFGTNFKNADVTVPKEVTSGKTPLNPKDPAPLPTLGQSKNRKSTWVALHAQSQKIKKMIHMKKPSTLARKAEPIEYLQRMSDMLGQNMSDGNNDSQSDGDSHSTLDATGKGGNKGGPKRRASRAGTRSVATLSEAQLARKRANDREAQRLIRQRTKDHIEQLERRIQELSGGQGDDGELHELRRRNSELEKELKDLKEIRTLSQASIASSESASRATGGRGVTNQAHFAAPTSYPTYMSAVDGSASASPLSVADNSWPPHTSPYGSMSNPPSSRGSFSPHNFQFDTGDMVDSSMGGVLGPSAVDPILADVESDRNWLPTGSSRSSPSVNAIRASIPAQQLQLPQPITSTPFSSQPPVPAWEIPIRTTPPTEPLENILLGVVQQQRNMALSGVTGALITGPYHPSMNMIVYPEQQHLTSHPVSSILSDLLVKTGVPRLPERAAALFSTYHFIQWQIYPSKMTFDALFDWQIPRTSQLLTPHPIWASLMAWGKLRDAVINDQAKYGTEEFQHIYTSSLNLNWPWREIDCFCFEKGGEIRISDEFERHISQLSNWSLDEPFARKYPELESVCKFTKAKSGGSSGAGPMGV